MEQNIVDLLQILQNLLMKPRQSEVQRTEVPRTEIDFEWIVTNARKQNIIPLVYDGLYKMGLAGEIPPELEYLMRNESTQIILEQIKHTQLFHEIYDQLRKAGIEPIVLKGIVCRSTYGEYCDHRISGDEDIWIEKDKFEQCRNILLQNGYQPEYDSSSNKILEQVQEVTFSHKTEEFHIEVHLNLFGDSGERDKKLNQVFAELHSKTVRMQIQGHEIVTLAPTEHMLYLLLHFQKHFVVAGVGIRQMLDIFMFEKTYHSLIDWKAIQDILSSFHVQYLFQDVFFIGFKYFGIDSPLSLETVNPKGLLYDMFESGVFGLDSKSHATAAQMTVAATEHTGKQNVIHLLFPSCDMLKDKYPILYKRKWMIPMIWVWRIGVFIIHSIEQARRGNNLAAESVKIGKDRIKLMKEYQIIS